MKRIRILTILGLVLCVIVSLAPSFTPVLADVGESEEFSEQRILVKFREGTSEDDKEEVGRRHGDFEHQDISSVGVRVIKVPAGKVAERLSAYRSDPRVAFAEPDYIARAIDTPNDPSFGSQWGLTQIQAPAAWSVATSVATVKIAILDSGVDQNHEDLVGKVVANHNFTTSTTVDDLYGHGTHVAGIAAASANNAVGVAGVGHNSSIMNVKVLGDTGSGSHSWIASGIIWAADNGAKVINMSLGGSSSSSTLESAVNYAWNKGVVVVAAAGNSGNSAPSYPGYYANVIAVGATTQTDSKASFSNYGSWVDVAAPGLSIYSTLPNHSNQIGAMNYGSLSGTSMASPFVAGLAALVWSTPYGTGAASVRNRIQSTADPITGTGSYWQYGRINAYKAVTPGAPVPDTKMHVQSIAMSLQRSGSPTRARATVTIVDTAGAPVAGAMVSGHWSGATTGTGSGTTYSSGSVVLGSSYVRRAPSGTAYAITVNSAALTGWTYDSAGVTTNSIIVP